MKRKQRYDSYRLAKAVIDENGFLNDNPIVARTGIQIYFMPDGSSRREFRPSSEVFAWEATQSFQGKPITMGHVTVTSKNAKEVSVGSCAGAAFVDRMDGMIDEVVRCPITITDQGAIDKAMSGEASELSVGYTTIDLEGKGRGNLRTGDYYFYDDVESRKQDDENFVVPDDNDPDWAEFDAVQTKIRVNHLAMCYRGRAGVAKLNLDSEQEFPYDEPELSTNEDSLEMVKIKIDEKEFEVAKEVAAHIQTLNGEKADALKSAQEAQAKIDGVEAQLMISKAKIDSFDSEVQKAVLEAQAKADAKAELIRVASEAGVKVDGLDEKAIKVAFVKAAMGKDIAEKSDAFIDTAFELAKDSDTMAAKRIAVGSEASLRNDEAELEIPNPLNRFRK